jgi:hypothetical protein
MVLKKNGRLGNNHLHTLQVAHKNASIQNFLSFSPNKADLLAKNILLTLLLRGMGSTTSQSAARLQYHYRRTTKTNGTGLFSVPGSAPFWSIGTQFNSPIFPGVVSPLVTLFLHVMA